MTQRKRKKLLVHLKLQLLLVLRVMVYWLACIATMEFLRLTWQIATGPEQPSFIAYFTSYDWRAAGLRLLMASALLVPIVWDMLVFSNRFAGPIFRMRRVLRDLAQGKAVKAVHLRDGDFLHGFVDDFNTALQHLAPGQIAGDGVSAQNREADDDISLDGTAEAEEPLDRYSAVR